MKPRLMGRVVRLLVAVLVTSLIASFGIGPASAEHAEIEGDGSSWAATIISAWIGDMTAAGLQITYTSTGSSQGRKDFAKGVVDFADSDIPYQGVDPISHQADSSNRPYAYLPVVAGGTAFTYQLVVAGKLVTNLRLSGKTIAEIFTNKITNWNDPQITKENGGHALPSLPITPVVRSDGSGSTAQFTLWMANEYPSLWRPYNSGSNALTSIYPRQGRQVAQNGDDGIMNYVNSSAGNGSIGYTEASYPQEAAYYANASQYPSMPMVYMENPAGYYVQPTQFNVAVALTRARIYGCKTSGSCSPKGLPANTYLTQDLRKVYTYKDPRSYPMSSYSYMIIPTSSTDQRMTPAKRQTVADFLKYALCAGQQETGDYGYSPMPLNLVQAAFTQLEKLGPDASPKPVPGVSVVNPVTSAAKNSCNNPTFVAGHLSENKLAEIAPQPLACQKATAAPCGDDVVPPGTTTKNSDSKTSDSTKPGTTPGTPGSPTDPGQSPPPGTTTGTTTGGSPGGTPGSTTPSTSPGGNVNPATGQPTSTEATATGSEVTPNSITLSANRQGDNKLFGGVAVLELLAIVMLPGLYVAWLRRRRGSR